ncbi:MAG: hypothetical protein HQM16_15605 [Deltaproteobacteria bacterium]|nr:hypothetical protein [Deltaproteobacteria bacterium]
MKKIFILALLVFVPWYSRASETGIVLSAAATSSTPDSTPVTCLLDPDCNGRWAPDSLDAGVNEGIYIQFENEILVNFIEITFVEPVSSLTKFTPYINGKTVTTNGTVFQVYPRTLLPVGTEGHNVIQIAGRNTADPVAPPMNVTIRSFFLKLGKYDWGQGQKRPVIKSIHFYNHGQEIDTILGPNHISRIPLKLPQLVPAKVTATSVLDPQRAYQPENLFDSKSDFAWSTDGKKTTGKGESLTIKLDQAVTLSGLMVWNGYQRSQTHFLANGRVTKAEVKTPEGQVRHIILKDAQGVQKVLFAKPLQNTKSFTLTITDLQQGDRYKDVLISEMRLLGENNAMILPVVTAPPLKIPGGLQPLVNRTWSSFIHSVESGDAACPQTCFNKNFRLRSNGTFVMYQDFNDEPFDTGDLTARVLEGNWEVLGETVRIFGKKYTTTLRHSEYMQAKGETPQPIIFQSLLTIKKYNTLTPAEKQGLLAFIFASRKGTLKIQDDPIAWYLMVADLTNPSVTGKTQDALLKTLDQQLKALDPYTIKSTELTDIVLPTDTVYECGGGC